jgi:hypothetical protein
LNLPEGKERKKAATPPPTLEAVLTFAEEKGIDRSLAEEFWYYWNGRGWYDNQGKYAGWRWRAALLSRRNHRAERASDALADEPRLPPPPED